MSSTVPEVPPKHQPVDVLEAAERARPGASAPGRVPMFRTHPSAEAIGQARLFQQRVIVADQQIINEVRSIIAVLQGKSSVPYSARLSIRRRVANLGGPLALHTSNDTEPGLLWKQWRINSAKLKDPGWHDVQWEPGIGVALVELRAARSGLRMVVAPSAHVSLHALARRLERVPSKRDDASLIADLSALRFPKPDDSVAVRAVTGYWLGKITLFGDAEHEPSPLFNVRTFIDLDSFDPSFPFH